MMGWDGRRGLGGGGAGGGGGEGGGGERNMETGIDLVRCAHATDFSNVADHREIYKNVSLIEIYFPRVFAYLNCLNYQQY